MLNLLFTNPWLFILSLGGIILAIGLHEAAHCYMADYLGDPTPRSLGRLTLNPLAHLDPLGTLVIIVTGAFGWGKPSPFDPYNLKNPARDTSLIALAGPVSNLLIASVFSFLMHVLQLPIQVQDLIKMYIFLNVNLAVFNLLPIPPLDGSKIFFPKTALASRNSQIGYMILIFLIITGLVSVILSPISNFLLHFLV